MLVHRVGAALIGVALVVIPALSAAQESVEGQIGAGFGFAPDYEGSNEFGLIPIVPFSIRYKGFGLQTAGRGVQLDVSGYQFIDFGPLFQFRPARDRDVKDRAVSLLPKIDPAYEVGGFFEMNLPFFRPGPDALTFIGRGSFDIGGAHDGYTIDSALRHSVPIGDDFRLNLIGGTTITSNNYNDTYFSITPGTSAQSGLTPFRADGGLKDISAVAATYFFAEHCGLTGIAGYKNLPGDAADSPVVEDRGSRHQLIGGIAMTYRF